MDKECTEKNPHYQLRDGMEVIDLLRAFPDYAGACRYNVIKYVSRYENKGKVQDLHKALYNLIELIETVSGEEYTPAREQALENECAELYREIDRLEEDNDRLREFQIAHIAIEPFEDNIMLLDNLGG